MKYNSEHSESGVRSVRRSRKRLKLSSAGYEEIEVSLHAQRRRQQRGFRNEDIGVLLACASLVSPDHIFLSSEDAAREIARRKHEIRLIERNQNRALVIQDGVIVTVYPADRREQKRLMRLDGKHRRPTPRRSKGSTGIARA